MKYKSRNLVVRLTEQQLEILNSRFDSKLRGLTPEEAQGFSVSEYVRQELNLPK